jgi:hypothetical protein
MDGGVWEWWHRVKYRRSYEILAQFREENRVYFERCKFTVAQMDAMSRVIRTTEDTICARLRVSQDSDMKIDQARYAEGGWTPLHQLALIYHELWPYVSQMIQEFRVDVNAVTDRQESALQIALFINNRSQATANQRQLVRILLEHGASPNFGQRCHKPLSTMVNYVYRCIYDQKYINFETRRIMIYLILYGAESDDTTALFPPTSTHQVLPFLKTTHLNWIQKMRLETIKTLTLFLPQPIVEIVNRFISLTFNDYDLAYSPSTSILVSEISDLK